MTAFIFQKRTALRAWVGYRRSIGVRLLTLVTVGILCQGQGCPSPSDTMQEDREVIDSSPVNTDNPTGEVPTEPQTNIPSDPTPNNSGNVSVNPSLPNGILRDGVVLIPPADPNPNVKREDVGKVDKKDEDAPEVPGLPDGKELAQEKLIDIVEVKFLDGYEIRLQDGVPTDLRGKGLTTDDAVKLLKRVSDGKWSPVFDIDEKMLGYMRKRASEYWGYKTSDLNLFFRLIPPEGMDAEEIRDAFANLREVEFATIAPKPETPPAPGSDFSVGAPADMLATPLQYQGYLDPAADGGVDARFAWTQPGGEGENVNVVDLEYAWTFSHEDLPNMGNLDQNGTFFSSDQAFIDHGDASMGVVVGRDNGFGAKGIASQATPYVNPVGEGAQYNVAEAILEAATQMDEGDIMLLEQQTSRNIMNDTGGCASSITQESISDCPKQLLPVEWNATTWVAIHTAVGNGIIVIEPAGNGGQNLNVLGEELADEINGGHDPFEVDGKGLRVKDSGAILVANGLSPRAEAANFQFDTARTRNLSSNYGECIDVQGWGDSIVTLGYADLFNGGGTGRYTSAFNGTSGASAIIAGVAASLQSIHKEIHGEPMSPYELRALLIATGTAAPQSRGPIGPLPNMRAAIEYVLGQLEAPTMVTPYNPSGAPAQAPFTFALEAPNGWDPDNVLMLVTLDGTDPDVYGDGYDDGGIGFEFAPGESLNFNYSVLVKYRAYLRRRADGTLFPPGEHPMSDVIEVPITLVDGTVPVPTYSIASGTYSGAQFLYFEVPTQFDQYEVWYTLALAPLPGEPYPGGPNSFRYNSAITLPINPTLFQPVTARAYAVSSTTGVPSASPLAQQLYMIQD